MSTQVWWRSTVHSHAPRLATPRIRGDAAKDDHRPSTQSRWKQFSWDSYDEQGWSYLRIFFSLWTTLGYWRSWARARTLAESMLQTQFMIVWIATLTRLPQHSLANYSTININVTQHFCFIATHGVIQHCFPITHALSFYFSLPFLLSIHLQSHTSFPKKPLLGPC